MRVKDLELQGYKTFAFKTEFVFGEGITAIVGPNGSGKSNIADAVRWVLGEQSYKTLRGKSTVDMIFSGSESRPRMGMAQAALTLDNSDGWLPVEFSEVTIARRAYRSGENEYLLNGNRVRLRDITELLATGGLSRRTYTVIGQGLVDTALSLRPEERRALFEEAAGVTVHQAKRDNAIAKLEATQQNLLRVNDIISEIGPRLERLKRQAERAQEYAQLSQELEGLLRLWYGYQWRQGQKALRQSRSKAREQRTQLEGRRKELAELEQRIAQVRAQQAEKREQLSQWHRESSTLHAEAEKLQRGLAVCQERKRLLSQQREEILHEITPLEVNREAQQERIAQIEEELSRIEGQLKESAAQIQEVQKQLDHHEGQRQALVERLAALRQQAFELSTGLADRQNRLIQLDERREELRGEREGHQQAIAGQEAQKAIAEEHLQAVKGQLDALQAQVQALVAQREDKEREIEAGQERQAQLQASLAEIQRQEERLLARQELLARMREEMAGYQSGVRRVMQAAGTGQLSGIVGTVVSLIEVPAELEAAIEMALGTHGQDIVIETWADAEAAIGFLKQTGRGRATFLPLDTVRSPEPISLPQETGVLGLAVELIGCETQLCPALNVLLGRAIVVEDLGTARRILGQVTRDSYPYQIVTLAGEMVHSNGTITGGATEEQGGGLLAHEREWRELPDRLADVGQKRQELEEQGQRAAEAYQQLLAMLANLEDRGSELRAASEARAAEADAAERQIERLAQEIEWRRGLERQLDDEMAALDEKETDIGQEMESLKADQASIQEEGAALEEQLETMTGDDLYEQLTQLKTALAVTEQSCEDRRTILRSHQANLQHLEGQIAAKQERADELAQEGKALAIQIEELQAREEELSGQIQALAELIEPTEVELVELEGQQVALESEESDFRSRLQRYETIYSQAALDMERRRDDLLSLRQQIQNDLGLVELEMTDLMPGQPPLPLKPLVSTLPSIDELPEGLEDEIQRLKIQLKRAGSINPNAPTEYAEALERHTFLTTQVEDLEQASSSLRQVIAELDQLMEADFRETFEAVAAEFKECFTTLFGGGAAKLVLTDPENLMETGIDIVVRPPGKRQQSLALLSGGERSLTAVALIFAILKASPTPFCILDEVDAMLDEVNVGRFRKMLQELADRTQFVVITHNRGTIEAANTIYGVSMGEDSVSKVISLKLEGEPVAT
ncbi:MAG: chromosome segregation protein SMC [Anaerolineales bacterium]|nr:MAG: chromosome segregation protein SMC [Anaerolineales bacterium]